MAVITYDDFIKNNKSTVYSVAEKLTNYNNDNRPTISKDDEWTIESEWDDLFMELSK